MSGHMKAAAAVHTGRNLTLMQHVGDLDNLDAQTRLLAEGQRAAADLFGTTPAWLAHDLHPDYGSTALAERAEIPAHPVPHHLAHVLALVAEQNVALPVLGVAFDGTGLGTDQSIWGGEFIRVRHKDGNKNAELEWQRVGSILPFPLPGGDQAIREPRRAALGVAWRMSGGNVEQLPACLRAMFTSTEWRALTGMLASNVNCPHTSSVGRLFDAVAAFAGLCTHADYDGEAAMLVEAAAAGGHIDACQETVIKSGVWDWRPLLRTLTSSRATTADLVAFFHAALADMICAMAARHGERRVLLTGGVFQNALLLQQATRKLRAAGMEVFVHRDTPPNDGSLALGQAFAIAAGHTETDTLSCV